MYLQLAIPHCIVDKKNLPPKFNVMFKLNYSKYNPRGIFSGGGDLYMEGVFLPKRPGAYTRWGLLSEFYGISGSGAN